MSETTPARKYIYLDGETLRFFQDPEIAHLPRSLQLLSLGLALVCTYSEGEGFQDFWIEKPGELERLWTYINHQHVTLLGWNIIDFDMVLINHELQAHNIEARAAHTSKYTVLDLFAEIKWDTGRWYKLSVIAQSNGLGNKLADGQQASEWLRSGDPALLQKAVEYCRHDVQLVRNIHERLLAGEMLVLPARPERKEQDDLRWMVTDFPF